MKAKIFVVLALLFLISFLLFKKYFNVSNADVLIQYTPNSCTSIIIINSNRIQKKLILDGVQHFAQIDSLQNTWIDSSFAILFQKIFESSITLNNQIVGFDYHRIRGVLVEYSNTKQFKHFITRDIPLLYNIELDTNSNLIQFINYPISLTWTDKHLYILYNNSTNTRDKLIKQLASHTTRKLQHSDSLLIKNSSENDISIFSQNHFSIDSIPFLKDINPLYANINFEKGAIQLSASFQFDNNKNYYDSLFTNTKQSIRQKQPSPLSFSICINPDLFFKQKKTTSWLQKIGLNDNVIKCWNGQFCYAYYGIDTIVQKFISYDYDDDFNKIETAKKVVKSINKHKLAIGYTNSTLLNSVFYSLKKEKLLHNNKGKLQIINAFDQPYFISDNNNWLCISGQTNDTTSFALYKKNIIEFNISPQGLQSNFINKFTTSAFNFQSLQFKNIHFDLQKNLTNNYNVNLNISFNSDLNGLFGLVKNAQGLK